MTTVEPAGDASLRPWFPDVVGPLLEARCSVPLYELLCLQDDLAHQATDTLRRLTTLLREHGYLQRALRVATELDSRADSAGTKVRDAIRGELSVLTGEIGLGAGPRAEPFRARAGRLLSVVGNSLPGVDSTYTRRTQAIALQASTLGVSVAVATQMGLEAAAAYEVEEVDGVGYHRIPGPPRGAVAFDEWLRLYTVRLSAIVRKTRPAAIVASSDYVNGLAARAVCREYGIPFAYDVRGFWEDSWLIRQRERNGWSEEQVPGRWGTPDVWRLRREREAELIATADVVVVGNATDRERASAVADGRQVGLLENPPGPGSLLSFLEDLGVLPRGGAALVRVAEDGFSLAEVRKQLQVDRPPLDAFAARRGGGGTVEATQSEGWRDGELDPVPITCPLDWVAACRDNRSQAFHLHAWDFMAPFIEAWDKGHDSEALAWCLHRAADWARTFRDGDARGTMAWYDMALGLRAPRLAYLLQEAVFEEADDQIIESLVEAVGWHQRKLFERASFNEKTNHGFYTAVGQLAFARRLHRLPGMSVISEQGRERLRAVATTQFAPDGGHLEHSPEYHRVLLASFKEAMAEGLLEEPAVVERLEAAGEVLGWFIQPNRCLVQIGDSPEREVDPATLGMSPHTVFLSTGGASGQPNSQELLLLRETGYAVVRSPQPKAQNDHLRAGYLSLMAAFHSRTHKHCDDLSITWFDAEQELLIDAGRFGYLDPLPMNSPKRDEGFFYSRPERQYVESTKAHNTVQADERDQERRTRAPYGSGIVSGEKRNGVFQLVGAVDHEAWRHRRSVSYSPGSWLLVEDELTSQDGNAHDFSVWWNLPGSLGAPEIEADGTVVFPLRGGRRLLIASKTDAQLAKPVRGQWEPMRGWRSTADFEITPAWSLGHSVAGRSAYTFRTLLTLEGIDDRPRATVHDHQATSGASKV